MKKFRYQAIYKINDYENVVFVGSTDLGLEDLLDSCTEHLDLTDCFDCTLLAVDYQPIEFKKNEKED